MKHLESYIDSEIETPQNLPSNILNILEMLSEYDQDDYFFTVYFDRLDDLYVMVKNAMAANAMSEKDWEIIVKKYWIKAETVFEKEFQNGYLQP